MDWKSKEHGIDYDILTYGLFCNTCLFSENAYSITKHPSCVSYALSYNIIIISAQMTGLLISSIIFPHNICASTTFGTLLSNTIIGHYAGNMRTKIREKYDIDGNLQEDFCVHFGCSPCAVCQEAQEIRFHSNTNILDDIDNYESATIIEKIPIVPLMTK